MERESLPKISEGSRTDYLVHAKPGEYVSLMFAKGLMGPGLNVVLTKTQTGYNVHLAPHEPFGACPGAISTLEIDFDEDGKQAFLKSSGLELKASREEELERIAEINKNWNTSQS